MQYTVAYAGRSQFAERAGDNRLAFAANLRRDAVAFDAALRQPLRFREAMSALHDVVVNDLRFQKRDKSGYEDWKRQQQAQQRSVYQNEFNRLQREVLQEAAADPQLTTQFNKARKRYWNLRLKYSALIMLTDPALWRLIMPCDPVITVADDVVFFECFSADESSYGCLTVERDAGFGASEQLQLGTTNVDYSWELYDHFQSLRSYRPTRLQVDPQGFTVNTGDSTDVREEKIDLPAGWLRGFMQLQSAMTLPMRKVSLDRSCVYSLLAWMKRHRPKTSPRALRFELLPGASPKLVLEPWQQPFVSHTTRYQGPPGEPIRIWGTRRLMFLSRVLPLADGIDVYLLGTGLPSFWVVRMGEMRLTIGNSGWTANDWTRASAIDLLRPPMKFSASVVHRVGTILRARRSLNRTDIADAVQAPANACLAALNFLALTGQVIYDLAAGVYRWRQVMPQALGEAEIGPDNAELAASRAIVAQHKALVTAQQDAGGGTTLITGIVDRTPVEVLLDADGLIKRAKCNCSHHHKFGIRQGPCRHLLALRQAAMKSADKEESLADWYDRLTRWAAN